ncbi:hypothetical protein [Scytonema sp. NUACC26]|uniref:hypothetical protein n=1 Tax=Scytonema sp. NUACC26 TaxID=3140176 RepID=UPI0034DC3ACB
MPYDSALNTFVVLLTPPQDDCTGGGFASKVIAQWILARLQINIPNGKIFVLSNPEKINMTGLKWLDPKVEVEASNPNA